MCAFLPPGSSFSSCHSGEPVCGVTELQVQRLSALPVCEGKEPYSAQPGLLAGITACGSGQRSTDTDFRGISCLICPKWLNPATLSSSLLFSTLSPRLQKWNIWIAESWTFVSVVSLRFCCAGALISTKGGCDPSGPARGPGCCSVLGADCSGRRSLLARKPVRVFAPCTQSLLVF